MTEDLSRRSLLTSLAAIGGAGALGGAGSVAFLSDREEFANNRLVAGQLDLRLAWRENYFGEAADEALAAGAFAPASFLSAPETTLEQYPDPGAAGAGTDFETAGAEARSACASGAFADAPDDLDPTESFRSLNTDTYDPATEAVRPLVRLQDAKPGDFGFTRFRLLLCDNDGFVSATGGIRSLQENGLTEPERKDPDQPTAPGTTAAGQLADEVRVRLYQDRTGGAAAGVFNTLAGVTSGQAFSESVFDAFGLRTAPTLREFANALEVGIPLDGNPFDGGGAGSVSTVDEDLFLYDVAAAIAGDTQRSCFEGGDATGQVGVIYALPVNHANEIQTDSVAVDLGFETQQCRHNDGSAAGAVLDVRVENVSPASDPVTLLPGVQSVAGQADSPLVFRAGMEAGPLAPLVRRGDAAPLLAALSADDLADRVGRFGDDPAEVSPDGHGPPVEPGEAYEFPVYVRETAPARLGFAVPVAGTSLAAPFVGPTDPVTIVDGDGAVNGPITDDLALFGVTEDGYVDGVAFGQAVGGVDGIEDLVEVTVSPR